MPGRRQLLCFVVSCLALVLVAAAPASADDVAVQLGVAMLEAVARFFLILAIVVLPLYLASIVFVEAAGLNVFLNLGYWRCFRYGLVANIASSLIGVLWYAAARLASGPVHEYVGWKSAFAGDASTALVIWLFIRSFAVTLLVEGLVLIGLLRGLRAPGDIFKGLAFANLLSYTMSAVIMAICMAAH